MVMRCKLEWHGHVSIHQVWPKLSCNERGKKRRQREKEVEDNIKEWTGLGFGKSERAVENREKWRKLVAKLPVVPQRPWRLRDR